MERELGPADLQSDRGVVFCGLCEQAANLQRTGQHNERGPESLAVMLPMMAGHDLSHLDQITRYIRAVRQE